MSNVSRLERLVNLVIALRETRIPLSAEQIGEQVAGYGGTWDASVRRAFERDKADLRDLGIPIVTVDDRWSDGTGYRILREDYELPPVRLTPQELTALALAVEITGLADEVGSGLDRLGVDAALSHPDAPGPAELRSPPRPDTPRVDLGLGEAHRSVLDGALRERRVVGFSYRKAGQGPTERTVEPHGLVHRAGRWYLVGRDVDRDARRVFRLDRIGSAVRAAGRPGAFELPPGGVSVDDVVPEPEPGAPDVAEVWALGPAAWQVARRAAGSGVPEGEGAVFRCPVGEPRLFVAWVLELGPDVEVRAPVELRVAVREGAAGALAGASAAGAAAGESGESGA